MDTTLGTDGVLVDKIYIWQLPENVERDQKDGTCTYNLEGFFPSNSSEELKDWLIFMESLFCPNNGTITDVVKENDAFIPVCSLNIWSKEMEADITYIQNNSLNCLRNFTDLLGERYCQFFHLTSAQPFISLMFHFVESNRKKATRFLDNIIFEDTFKNAEDVSLGYMIRKFNQPKFIISVKVFVYNLFIGVKKVLK